MLPFLAPWYHPLVKDHWSLLSVHQSVVELVRIQLSRAQGLHSQSVKQLSALPQYQLPLVATRGLLAPQGKARALGTGVSPPVWLQGGSAPGMGDRWGTTAPTTVQAALREWAPQGDIVCGYMVTDARRNVVVVVMLCALRVSYSWSTSFIWWQGIFLGWGATSSTDGTRALPFGHLPAPG